MTKKVLWFSRHEMTGEQRAALGDVEIVQVNRTINSAFELKDEIDACDIIAIVAPIHLQKQFLDLSNGKPVIIALNQRILVPGENGGEDKVTFKFNGWQRIVKIDVITEEFTM